MGRELVQGHGVWEKTPLLPALESDRGLASNPDSNICISEGYKDATQREPQFPQLAKRISQPLCVAASTCPPIAQNEPLIPTGKMQPDVNDAQ